MSGTSVATPQITRCIADELASTAAGGTRAWIRQAAADEEAIKAWRPPLPRRIRAGTGRIVGDFTRLPRFDP
jgi:hypothetical protein